MITKRWKVIGKNPKLGPITELPVADIARQREFNQRKTATKRKNEEAGKDNPNLGTETGEQKGKKWQKHRKKVNYSPKTIYQLKDLHVVDIF